MRAVALTGTEYAGRGHIRLRDGSCPLGGLDMPGKHPQGCRGAVGVVEETRHSFAVMAGCLDLLTIPDAAR